MKTSLAVVGIIVVIVGAAVLYAGASSPTTTQSTSTTSASAVLAPKTFRTVDAGGLWAPGSAVLSQGESVNGTISVSNYNASAGKLFFYVMNTSEWVDWGGCAPCKEANYLNKTIQGGNLAFTWTVPASTSYYFVVDASYYSAKPQMTYASSVSGTTTQVVNIASPNTTFDYGGMAAMILGAVVLAAGLAGGSSKKTSPPPTT